ncbi:MAG: hypothetical protein KDK39_17220 [Leptospiraceae bacterium]|nr:hypothetical protein [Leptospiraceae bacterium]
MAKAHTLPFSGRIGALVSKQALEFGIVNPLCTAASINEYQNAEESGAGENSRCSASS